MNERFEGHHPSCRDGDSGTRAKAKIEGTRALFEKDQRRNWISEQNIPRSIVLSVLAYFRRRGKKGSISDSPSAIPGNRLPFTWHLVFFTPANSFLNPRIPHAFQLPITKLALLLVLEGLERSRGLACQQNNVKDTVSR